MPHKNSGALPAIDQSHPVAARIDRSHYRVSMNAGGHELLADEPESHGGANAGPSPYDYLLAALGSCTAMTLRMYADRKDLPLDEVTVQMNYERVHAKDCEQCESASGMVGRIERVVYMKGDLSHEQRAKLLEIADKCPVHRTLTSEMIIHTKQGEQ